MSKKLLLSLVAATLVGGTMLAQVANPVIPSTVELTPYDDMGVDLPSVNSQITVTMDAVPNVPVTVMYITGNGFAMNMNYERISVDEKKTFTIPLSREKWGVPYNEVYYLNLVVTFTYGEGDEIDYYVNPDTNEPVVASCMYMTKDTGDARLELTFPNQQNIDNEMYTISQAYQSGVCTAYFSKEVKAENASGYIYIAGKDGEELAYSDLEFDNAEWSEMDGLYKVDFKYTPDSIFIESEVSEMDITFEGIFVDEVEMTIPEIVLFPASSSNRAPQKKAKGKLASDMSVTTDGLKVFNIQGNLVKDNASQNDVNALPTGLYIVNGKKVLVK